MSELEFLPVTLSTLDGIIELKVRDEQASLIADNLYSVAQAVLDPEGDCRGVTLDGRPVGFFYTRRLNEGRLLYVCRFMVDGREQGRGLGRRTMRKFVDEAFAVPALELIDLAVSDEPGNAEAFYAKCGFVPTGEAYRGGRRMVLTRARYAQWRAEQP